MAGVGRGLEKKFAIIWSGQAISLLTSSILQMAIVWYLTKKTGSAAVLSFATLIGYLPAAILGMLIGTFVDRHSKKRMIVLSDLFIAFLGVVLAVGSLQGEIPIWLIMVVLLLRSIGTAFHYPALQSITPLIVPREQLTKYAGYSQSFESLSMVLSPALAALLFSIWDITAIICLDVIGALVAVCMLYVIEIPEKRVLQIQKKASILKETVDGFKELRHVRGMPQLMAIGALYAIIYFPIGTLYPFMTMEYFNGTVAQSGMVEMIFAVGSLLGAITLGVIGEKIPQIPTMALSIAVYGGGVLLSGLLPPGGLKVFIVMSLVMGIFVPFYTGIETAIFQEKFQQEYLGRIFSLSSSVSMVAMPLGLILSGIFTDKIGINILFIIAGVLTLILAASMLMLPILRDCSNHEV